MKFRKQSKIVFFGTPPFAARILSYLLEHHLDIVGIVTRPDRPKGRDLKLQPSAVKELALQACPNIPLFQPEKASTDEFAQRLKALQPDLFVVVAYGEIIKTNLLSIPKLCINIHASLLPKYRGAAPIQRCLMNGEKISGVTIMEMVLQMDAGDMLDVAKIPVPDEMTFGELEEALCNLSGPLLLSVLQRAQQGTITKTPQNHAEATFAPKITAEDRIIDWKKSAKVIHDQIRSLSPFPGAYALVNVGEAQKKLLIKRSSCLPEMSGIAGETLHYGAEGWIIACGSGALKILELQLEGKKPLSIGEFIRGTQLSHIKIV